MSRAEHLHHAGQQPIGTSTHVNGIDRQPQAIDPDHRNHSRSQTAHAAACCAGQFTTTVVGPRKEVADMLRHRELDTAQIYAKVDIGRLAAVTMPWPGSAK